MNDKNNEFSFPLERSPAMKILGSLWTGTFVGQLLVIILLFIGILFLGNQSFNFLSISFLVGFILPIIYFMQTRIVKKGKILMKPWCNIKIENDTLHFKTGFPNTTTPGWQEVKLEDQNRNFIIKGSQVGGYHLRLGGEFIIRLGLWMELEDARNAAIDLSALTKGKVSENISDDESMD